MNSKLRLASLAAGLFCAGLLWAGDPWQEKPYTEWSHRDAEKVLNNSPWASTEEIFLSAPVGGGSPGEIRRLPDDLARRWVDPNRYNDAAQSLWQQRTGQRGVPLEATVTGVVIVQWASSLTLRQALVRQGQLYGRGTDAEAEQLLSLPLEHYVVAVYRSDLSSFTDVTGDTARAAAYLELKPSKRKMPPALVQLVRWGDVLTHVEFYFPRESQGQPTIGPAETGVTFYWQHGKQSTRVDFDLRKMVREGKPDL